MSFKIVRNDITKMNTEAIVNTANDSVSKAVCALRRADAFSVGSAIDECVGEENINKDYIKRNGKRGGRR